MELGFVLGVTGSKVCSLDIISQNQHHLYLCLALPLPTLPRNCSVNIVCLESLGHDLYFERKKFRNSTTAGEIDFLRSPT